MKFFNHDQEGAPTLTLDTPVTVTEKMDGSMGILYQMPDGEWAIATRGSFASDQALWATEFYRVNYLNKWTPNPGITYIFEIIYPENRIVVNYGDKQDLVLIAEVGKESGHSYPICEWTPNGAHAWPGPIVETHDFKTYGDVIASDQRENKEGFVLWNQEFDWRVKIKHEEYMVLHRFMTNTSPKNIWEVLSTGGNPAEVFALAPDEFHEWMRGVIKDLEDEYNDILFTAQNQLAAVMQGLGESNDSRGYFIVRNVEGMRRDFASLASTHKHQALLFKMLDERPVEETIWKLLKPRGDEKMVLRVVNPDAD
jgi:RNA ligase